MRNVGDGHSMKGLTVLLAVGSALAATPAAAEEACTGPPGPLRLYVEVANVRSSAGLVAVTLYADDSRRFLARRGSLYVGRMPARQGRTRVCIHLPRAGVYALAVYHDEDGDRRFDRTAIGLPAEGFGFSNNPGTLFGIPAFRAVRMPVPRDGLQAEIRLRYP